MAIAPWDLLLAWPPPAPQDSLTLPGSAYVRCRKLPAAIQRRRPINIRIEAHWPGNTLRYHLISESILAKFILVQINSMLILTKLALDLIYSIEIR